MTESKIVTTREFFRTGYIDDVYDDETVIHIYFGGTDRRVAIGHWYNDSVLDFVFSLSYQVTYYKKENFMNGHTRLDIVIDRI